MFLIDHLYISNIQRTQKYSEVMYYSQTKMFFSFLSIDFNHSRFEILEIFFSNFWPRPASFSKCTSFQHLHQSWKPRRPLSTNLINLALKKFQCNQTWKRISFYVIAQFFKHVNQAFTISFFIIIWAYQNTRIFTCTKIFLKYCYLADNTEWRWHVLEILITPFHLKW